MDVFELVEYCEKQADYAASITDPRCAENAEKTAGIFNEIAELLLHGEGVSNGIISFKEDLERMMSTYRNEGFFIILNMVHNMFMEHFPWV